MKRLVIIALWIIHFLLFTGCIEQNQEREKHSPPKNSILIADTITVDVTLRAQDLTNIWEVEQHKYVNQKAFVDYIFNGIYQKQLKTYDFFTGEEMSVRDVKKIEAEPGYSRDFISKIQFKEFWYIDSAGNLQKRIFCYTLGYEKKSEQGTFMGHKALFTIRLQ